MRFLANGPNIPDHLLKKRDEGRCIFLCGAGVSIPSGMPQFYGLAEYVIDKLDPPEDGTIMADFQPWRDGKSGAKTPLDQIFNALYQEYGREEVNALVEKRLTEKKVTGPSREHQLIARISADLDRNPQVVTTNFDHLFEDAVSGNVDVRIAPALASIDHGEMISGITYLHGRVGKSDSYVLGSADFGRAYLAEAWATSFVMQLIKHYTVVLVGYGAEDPPVKYLLQGLRQVDGIDPQKLYVFDRGRHEDIEAKWADRGVTPIAYSGEGQDHSALWDTIEAWADRADNPRVWCRNIIEQAKKGPRSLQAHERGQVVHLVRTTAGAKLFARSTPIITPEWLCVFDASCRTGKPASGYAKDSEVFDPFKEYCLDDDLERLSANTDKKGRVFDDLTNWHFGDGNKNQIHSLGTFPLPSRMPLPSRLNSLLWWIAQNLDNPITAWWAFRQFRLHPSLLDAFRHMLRDKKDLSRKARKLLNILLEIHTDPINSDRNFSLHQLKGRISLEGWTQSALRELERIMVPEFRSSRPFEIAAGKPPMDGWFATRVSEVTRLEVKFPEPRISVGELPDDVLEAIFLVAERCLIRGSDMLSELDVILFTTATCYPDREAEGEREDRRTSGFFKWFLELFAKLSIVSPKIARNRAALWSEKDTYFFRKLKFFAFSRKELFDDSEAASFLLFCENEAFWDLNARRELLFFIEDRWEGFSSQERKRLIERVFQGPDKLADQSPEEYENWRLNMIASYLSWLTLHGCELPPEQINRLAELKAGLADWDDRSAKGLTFISGAMVHTVSVDENPEALFGKPLSKIADIAESQSQRGWGEFTERRPFSGLVKLNPRTALAALSIQTKEGKYPKDRWSELLKYWPQDTGPRLTNVFLRRIYRLPDGVIRELRHEVSSWVKESLPGLHGADPNCAWKIFDNIVRALSQNIHEATESSILTQSFDGEKNERSRRTIDHAINGPIGNITEGVLDALTELKLDKGHGLPKEFSCRLIELMHVEGEGSDHAVCLIAKRIRWLHFLDAEWVKKYLIPFFNIEHPYSEPAWEGALLRFEPFHDQIWATIKDSFLELFTPNIKWQLSSNQKEAAVHILLVLGMFRLEMTDGVTAKEVRRSLRSMDDEMRADAIYLLSRFGKENEDGWAKYVIPFVSTVWPLERKFRTSSSASAWLSTLSSAGDAFPKLLKVVMKFLVPIRVNHEIFRFSREIADEDALVAKYPEEVLSLLNTVVPDAASDDLSELGRILEEIEQNNPELVNSRHFHRLSDVLESV
ncbi:SIR2 family protein [Thalassospira indica]|uniref:SIR2-like domain-containing protein n=1 Tax=Thalassospira indica TaxID=1891279 RepID=A0ABM6XXJ1_9PROT|nr:SIR2 family protein [Thalassospira indica]AXO14398.1 hypothetical protein DY252_09310 [Thalassospira indica]OAZ11345.1 hypothetical protein TH15_17890 [Thalassospira profundimaris]